MTEIKEAKPIKHVDNKRCPCGPTFKADPVKRKVEIVHQ